MCLQDLSAQMHALEMSLDPHDEEKLSGSLEGAVTAEQAVPVLPAAPAHTLPVPEGRAASAKPVPAEAQPERVEQPAPAHVPPVPLAVPSGLAESAEQLDATAEAGGLSKPDVYSSQEFVVADYLRAEGEFSTLESGTSPAGGFS